MNKQSIEELIIWKIKKKCYNIVELYKVQTKIERMLLSFLFLLGLLYFHIEIQAVNSFGSW